MTKLMIIGRGTNVTAAIQMTGHLP